MTTKRIRIESGGTSFNTRVFDENGEEFMSVVKAEWSCEVGEVAFAKITFVGVDVDVHGESESA